jgi:hypothetical protein
MIARDLWKVFVLRLRKGSITVIRAVVLIGLLVLVLNCNIPACSAISLPIIINNGAQFTNSTTVTLTLNASTFQPNIPSTAEMCIKNNNQAETIWEPYSTSKNWTLTSGDGLKTVYFRIRLDSSSTPLQLQFGNIILDTTAPLLELTSPSINETGWGSSFLQVDWMATDAGSGVNHAEVSLDNGGWIDVATQTTFNFTGLSNGQHTFAIRAVDNAGNSQTTSKSVTVNVTSPTPTPTPSSTSLDGGIITWLIAGAIAAAVAIAVAAVIVSKRKKEAKGAKRS